MSPYWYALRVIQAFEDRIIESILRQPGFHRAVGRIHRAIHEKQHGRNPHEPLAPGEATADPNPGGRADGFFKHFLNELKNQARGKPSDISDKPPTK
ncbi:hypothetical protein BBK36DRAFT_2450 [Trichoderma citrinoviride]|uniref:Uncharacterized protein n=1 Tax=Trichoderma citrinoviride TaxID=58853 RepID=A0A2T4BIJ6_9HYPO|nr:hypothetical protein BBK36DRAFT_2450 [Trichoderma citrinoviride]PTB69079.1 hypothetical protein BBK36DRAFT_2450 [Trichoderma citrinoviride]